MRSLKARDLWLKRKTTAAAPRPLSESDLSPDERRQLNHQTGALTASEQLHEQMKQYMRTHPGTDPSAALRYVLADPDNELLREVYTGGRMFFPTRRT
jgi:hypothetical protein